MEHAFELTPLLAAAVIGAAVMFLIANSANLSTPDTTQSGLQGTLLTGAAVGASVQIGVRLLGVS